jgi:hypothetical protein
VGRSIGPAGQAIFKAGIRNNISGAQRRQVDGSDSEKEERLGAWHYIVIVITQNNQWPDCDS